ncbi:MAG: hypothetical protein M3O70_20435, partial [Actinomycetota bacterium]|nr:hypothetical protein [Actinomycetota bacterium]
MVFPCRTRSQPRLKLGPAMDAQQLDGPPIQVDRPPRPRRLLIVDEHVAVGGLDQGRKHGERGRLKIDGRPAHAEQFAAA